MILLKIVSNMTDLLSLEFFIGINLKRLFEASNSGFQSSFSHLPASKVLTAFVECGVCVINSTLLLLQVLRKLMLRGDFYFYSFKRFLVRKGYFASNFVACFKIWYLVIQIFIIHYLPLLIWRLTKNFIILCFCYRQVLLLLSPSKVHFLLPKLAEK